jgi:hypothetical protein
MRRHLIALALSGGLATLCVSLNPAAALATSAKTWTVSPGGPVTAVAKHVSLEDTTTGTVVKCSSSSDEGTVKSGSGLSGTDLAETEKVTFTGCTGDGLAFTVTTSASAATPWELDAESYNASTGATRGTVNDISATLSAAGCSAEVDGTSATGSNGIVAGTYTNSTAKMKVAKTGGNLHIYDVDGCQGLIADGDTAGFVGTYTLSPPQTITSP